MPSPRRTTKLPLNLATGSDPVRGLATGA